MLDVLDMKPERWLTAFRRGHTDYVGKRKVRLELPGRERPNEVQGCSEGGREINL